MSSPLVTWSPGLAPRFTRDPAPTGGGPGDLDALLQRALAYLGEVIPFDLAAVLQLDGDELSVRCARGRLADARVRAHRVRLSELPGVRLALETRRTRVLRAHDHADEGDPYDAVLDLPRGHACMVVPLYAGDRTLGAMTFDRAECEVYDAAMAELATLHGQLVALAMLAGERAAELAREKARLEEERRLLLEALPEADDPAGPLEASLDPAMLRLVRLAEQVAEADFPVLLRGERWSGQEALARALHGWSRRRAAPFVKVSCAALPADVGEAELFGRAGSARPGRVAVADRGTLFLDDVETLSPGAQARLLRLLEAGVVEPVGGDAAAPVDVRVVAAAGEALEAAVGAGRFPGPLMERLAVFPLELPPLRARPTDVPRIAERWLARAHRRTGRGPWTLGPRAREALASHPWPGNLRELFHALEGATLLAAAGELSALDLAPGATGAGRAGGAVTLADLEREHVAQVLARTGGRIYGRGGAAELLGLKPSTLQSRLARMGLVRPGRGEVDRDALDPGAPAGDATEP